MFLSQRDIKIKIIRMTARLTIVKKYNIYGILIFNRILPVINRLKGTLRTINPIKKAFI